MYMNTGNIQGAFAGMVLLMIIIIFGIYLIGEHQYKRPLAFGFALVGCIGLTIGLKSAILEGDRSLNEKDIGDIILNGVISVFAVVGTMVLYISHRLLISRAFENTFGYKFISIFGSLKETIGAVFTGNPNYDYSIIATQLFDDQFTENSEENKNMLNRVASMFSGVQVNENITTKIGDTDETPITNLKKLITKKHQVSEATLTSLATIIAFYISYLPVWKPWIRS